jgi:mannose-6-phosphate isomerase-like protein (cupin superfamily)
MNDFPEFMKNPLNRIDKAKQYTDDIEGYVFQGKDGSQIAYWICHKDRDSAEHTHEYDEYFVVVQGEYTVIIDGSEMVYDKGSECYIPKGTPHSGLSKAGTRTIHCFGGKRI